jgi:hypothetical protein
MLAAGPRTLEKHVKTFCGSRFALPQALEARSLKGMTPPNVNTPPPARPKVVVKGPIRCHKCQMRCQDAEQYLNHVCVPRSPQT